MHIFRDDLLAPFAKPHYNTAINVITTNCLKQIRHYFESAPKNMFEKAQTQNVHDCGLGRRHSSG